MFAAMWPAYRASWLKEGRGAPRSQHLHGDAGCLDARASADVRAQAFLEEPLHGDGLASGFGTLYTAVYFPATGRAEYRWRDDVMTQSFDETKERR